MTIKALFLDRDGVININYGYVHKKEDFHFIDGIFNLAKTAIDKGYLIFIITNQSGIGRGYYTEDDFWNLSEWMVNQFLDRAIPITKIYFCPYHPTEALSEYRLDSFDRKPNPGMILKAAREFSINLSKSLLIGDSLSDINAGISAGIGLNLLYDPKNDCHLSDINITNKNKRNTVAVQKIIDASIYLKNVG
jgi:D-glycero-D-manno-heptose 1,7-bisphosphate phosphatase